MKNSTMKKMMVALCIGIFTMAGCQKDKGLGGDSDSNVMLLSEISVDDVLVQRLEYDDKNLLTKQFIYDNSKLISTRIYIYNNANVPIRIVNDMAKDDVIEEYAYDNDGKLISGTLNSEGKLVWSHTFKHEKNKLIQTSVSFDSQTNVNTFTFDDRGNLVKMDYLHNSVPAGINEWFDYDDKKGAAGSGGDAVSMLFASPNNPRVARHSFLNQVIEYDLKYTYNEAGYPTQMMRYTKGTDELLDVSNYKYILAR